VNRGLASGRLCKSQDAEISRWCRLVPAIDCLRDHEHRSRCQSYLLTSVACTEPRSVRCDKKCCLHCRPQTGASTASAPPRKSLLDDFRSGVEKAWFRGRFAAFPALLLRRGPPAPLTPIGRSEILCCSRKSGPKASRRTFRNQNAIRPRECVLHIAIATSLRLEISMLFASLFTSAPLNIPVIHVDGVDNQRAIRIHRHRAWPERVGCFAASVKHICPVAAPSSSIAINASPPPAVPGAQILHRHRLHDGQRPPRYDSIAGAMSGVRNEPISCARLSAEICTRPPCPPPPCAPASCCQPLARNVASVETITVAPRAAPAIHHHNRFGAAPPPPQDVAPAENGSHPEWNASPLQDRAFNPAKNIFES